MATKYLVDDPHANANRAKWYRMPERESIPCSVDMDIKVGRFIKAQRLVVRVGQYWQTKDMLSSNMNNQALALLKRRLLEERDVALNAAQWEAILQELAGYQACQRVESLEATPAWVRIFPMFYHLYPAVRAQWLKEQWERSDHVKDQGRRTLWYMDMPQPRWFYVTGVATYHLGMTVPGWARTPKTPHQLYISQLVMLSIRPHTWYRGIHPLDVLGTQRPGEPFESANYEL